MIVLCYSSSVRRNGILPEVKDSVLHLGPSPRQRKSSFSQCLPMLFRRSSKGLRDIGCERPHAALVGLDHVIAAGIEADWLVVHIQPPAPQLSPPLLVGQPCRGIPVVVFDPHPPSCVIAQSKRVIQVPRHVLNVAVQAHARVEDANFPFWFL